MQSRNRDGPGPGQFRAALRIRLRLLAAEARSVVQSGFGLTARERDGVMLVAALMVFGLTVRWLRWLLSA